LLSILREDPISTFLIPKNGGPETTRVEGEATTAVAAVAAITEGEVTIGVAATTAVVVTTTAVAVIVVMTGAVATIVTAETTGEVATIGTAETIEELATIVNAGMIGGAMIAVAAATTAMTGEVATIVTAETIVVATTVTAAMTGAVTIAIVGTIGAAMTAAEVATIATDRMIVIVGTTGGATVVMIATAVTTDLAAMIGNAEAMTAAEEATTGIVTIAIVVMIAALAPTHRTIADLVIQMRSAPTEKNKTSALIRKPKMLLIPRREKSRLVLAQPLISQKILRLLLLQKKPRKTRKKIKGSPAISTIHAECRVSQSEVRHFPFFNQYPDKFLSSLTDRPSKIMRVNIPLRAIAPGRVTKYECRLPKWEGECRVGKRAQKNQ
jgi:hypothetical protein